MGTSTNFAAGTQPSAFVSRLTSLWALYGLTFRQHLNGRRWMVMAALFLLPAGLAVLIRTVAPQAPLITLEFLLAFMFVPQALLPLVALVYASGIIQDEQEEQTLTYLLIRPISKWAIYLAKLAATLTTTTALTAVFTILTYAAVYIGGEAAFRDVLSRCAKAVAIHVLAVTAYCCLFGFLSLLTKRTLVVGIIYTALIEGLLANLPFGIRLITVIYYTRLIAYRSMDFVLVRPFGSVNIAADAWQLRVDQDPTLTAHPTTQTCLTMLIAASILLSALAAHLASRREFRVKTPEGS